MGDKYHVVFELGLQFFDTMINIPLKYSKAQ
jgi:hypothetical protein